MEVLILAIISVEFLVLVFFGYMIYVTNVKLEEYKDLITKVETAITNFHEEDKNLWKEVAIVLKRILEIS